MKPLVYLFARTGVRLHSLGVRIDIDAVPVSERASANRARTRIRGALGPFARRVSQVRLSREHGPGAPQGSRWVAHVALVGGEAFEVGQATPSDDEGAVDHFVDRVRRAVARRLASAAGGGL